MFAASKTASGALTTTDPDFENVVLLLNDTGTNGQQNNTFLDSSSNNFTVTRNSTPTQGSVTPYIPDGQWSNYFGGSSDALSNTSVALITQTVSTFTVEGWVYMTATPTGNDTISGFVTLDGQLSAGTNALSFGPTSTGVLSLYWFDGASKSVKSTTALNLNQWYHVACVVSSNSIKFYLNGVSQTLTGTTTLTNRNQTTSDFSVGKNFYSAIIGYISNVRVTTTAVYTADFIPPTNPLTAIANTVLLTCQSNRFVDNSSNNYALTVNGGPRTQIFSAFSGDEPYSTALFGGSAFMNGTSDYLTLPSNTAFTFGTGDFTVEAWVYHRVAGVLEVYLDQTTNGFGLSRSSGNKVQFAQANVAALLTSTTNLVINQWNHVAVTRSGTTGRLFLNGVLEASATMTTNFSPTTTTTVGRLFTGASNYFNGFMSNLRIIKGAAIYTAAFTPPTAPVTSTAQTSALLNFTNAGIFDSAAINDLSTIADAQVSTTQAKFGGSAVYLDGTGDYLTCIDTFATRFGTANFTVELWVYLSRINVQQNLVAKGTASTGWGFGINSTNQLFFIHSANGSASATGATTLTTGQWYHVALVRSGSATGNVKIYLNGTQDAAVGTAVTADFNQTDNLNIGVGRTAASPLQGYIDQLRLTNGIARYTASFTPPTQPFPTR